MTIDLASLDLTPAGTHLGRSADVWYRAWLDIAGGRHILDLVSVRVDRHGDLRAASQELDAMVHLHHLACGALTPFAPVAFRGRRYVLFVSPASA